MAFENGEAGETFFRLELEDDGSSVKSEEPLEQVEGNTENDSLDESDSSQSTATQLTSVKQKVKKFDGYRKKRRKRHKLTLGAACASKPKWLYKCTNFIKEDHKQPIFGIQFYQCLLENEPDPLVFATVGSNRISVYKCEEGEGRITLLQSYIDSDPEENFYTCAWSYNPDNGDPYLAYAGSKGILHIVNSASRQCIKSYQGHGSSINELKFHPLDPCLILSASKDHTLRLWNVKTDVCVAIFGGVDGHRDEVLGIDYDILGTKIVSCGMDHSLKIWSLDNPKLKQAIEDSYDYDPVTHNKSFPTYRIHYPEFSTRDIHRNYVDCVRWLGDLVLSKSCDNQVICWKPKLALEELLKKKHNTDVGVSILHKFEYNQCEIWFIRFALDYQQKILAVGNQTGKIFLWDLDVDQPAAARCMNLSYPRCNTPIRQVTFSRDGGILLAVSDDGTIWRWDKQS